MQTLNDRANTSEEFEKAYCKVCGAVYYGRAWHWSKHKYEDFVRQSFPAVTCGACYKIQNDLPEGIISLIGINERAQKSGILQDLESVISQATEKNPLDRIIRTNEKSDEIVVYTTDAQLAKKVGRHISRRYQGSLSIDSSGGDKLARVVWISSER